MKKMTEAELNTLADDLWEKHAYTDQHGYKDLMHESNFFLAVKELVQKFEGNK